MADQIVDDLLDMFPDDVTIERVTRNSFGTVTGVTSSETVKARVVGKIKNVIDSGGQPTTSSVQAYLAGTPGATTNDVFTLPARFDPNKPKPLSVLRQTDENGPHHEVVFFR